MARGGTASLVLREIPHRKTAYVRLMTVTDLPGLLEECAGFCRSCGAERIFASKGTEPLPLPHAHDMLLLHVKKAALPPASAPVELRPMEPDNDAIYQRIMNRSFREVSGAATYERSDILRIYRENQKAFLALTKDKLPFGIGEIHGGELAAVAVLPEFRGRGLGRALTLALAEECEGDEVELTAASDNEAALGLYDSLGFTVKGTLSAWYVL